MKQSLRLLILSLIAAFVLVPCARASTGEADLIPLAESSGAIDWKNPNSSEVAYVGARAGALFLMLVKATRTGTSEDQKIAEALEKKARTFVAVGKMFELSTKTGTEEGFNKRLLLLVERYAAMMRESKELNNTLFPPFVRSDVEAANKVWPYFEALGGGASTEQ